MLENTPDNRKQALSLLRAGRLDPARAAYQAWGPYRAKRALGEATRPKASY